MRLSQRTETCNPIERFIGKPPLIQIKTAARRGPRRFPIQGAAEVGALLRRAITGR